MIAQLKNHSTSSKATMQNHEVAQWLREYGVDDFQGACTFTYRGRMEFTIELASDQATLMLSSHVGTLPGNEDPALLRHLLKMNHLGLATQGATLSLDESGEKVILWISIPCEMQDPERMNRSVETFLDLSEQFETELQTV